MTGSRWNVESIRKEQSAKWVEATADWTADELREKLAELSTAIYPIWYTLSHLNDNPDRPHGGMAVTSDLFPLHAQEHDESEGDLPDNYGSKFDVAAKTWQIIPIEWDKPKPDRYSTEEVSFDPGVTLHESYEVLAVWQYATAASIFCGSFNTNDIARLEEAFKRNKAITPSPGAEARQP